MRILEICTADSLGGLELYFASCCEQLSNESNQLLACVSMESKLHQRLHEQNIQCSFVDGDLYSRIRNLKKVVRDFRPEIVHVHHKKDLFLVSIVKRIVKIPFIYVHTRQMDLPGKKKNLYHNFVYSSIDLMIAITDKLRNQILDRVRIDPEKVIRLYYGVPEIAPNESRCVELSIDKNKFNIGVIARIDRKKDQHVIIEAIQILRGEGHNGIHVFLIGGSTDKEYEEEIRKRIEENRLGEQIHLVGFIKNPQELTPCFDTVVLTTSNETFGLVLPEAMRMAVPVIGADGGGVPEIITHKKTGLIFKAGDSESLSEQILEMMNLSVREKLARDGKTFADKEFDLDIHFNRLQSLFDDVVSK